MTDTFRMYRKPGPPGEYYGYIEIGGVSYRFTAKPLPDNRPNAPKRSKYFTGPVERNLKADQQQLFGIPVRVDASVPPGKILIESGGKEFVVPVLDADFNDPLPEKL